MNEPGSAIRHTLLSRSAAVFLIRAFPAAASAAVIIAFSHLLPKEVNGAYQQLWVYLAVLLATGLLGLPSLMFTHTPQTINRWLKGLRQRHIVLYSVWLSLLSLLFIAIFPARIFPLWLIFFLLYAQAMILLLETYLIICQRFLLTAIASLVYSLLFCALHYLLIRGAISFTQLVGGIAILSWLRAITLLIPAQSQYSRYKSELSSDLMSPLIRKQWIQLGVYDISQVIFRWIDKVIVSWIVGPALFAIYLTGTTDVPLMPLLLGAVGNVLLQQLAVTGGHNHEDRVRLANYSGILLGRIVFPLFFFLLAFRVEFVAVLFSERYLTAVPLFAISIMALPLRAYNYTSMLQHLNKVKMINWGALLDLALALALSYPLFQWYGLVGVAFAFMISSYAQAALYLFLTARLLRTSVLHLIPWKQWSVMLIVFGCVAIGLHEVLVRIGSYRQSLLLGFIGTAIVVAIALGPMIFTKKSHG